MAQVRPPSERADARMHAGENDVYVGCLLCVCPEFENAADIDSVRNIIPDIG